MGSRVIVMEADSAEETEALGRAIEGVLSRMRGAPVTAEPMGPPMEGVTALPAATEEERQVTGDGSQLTETTTDRGEAAVTGERPVVREEKYACPECGRSCATLQAYGTHRAKAHGVPGESRPRRERQRTARVPPERDGAYQCPECDRRFATAQGLGRHRKNRHGVAGTSRSARARAKARTETQSTTDSEGTAATAGAVVTGERPVVREEATTTIAAAQRRRRTFQERTQLGVSPAAQRAAERGVLRASVLSRAPLESSSVGGGSEDDEA